MLTTTINDRTFVLNGKTYKAGERLQLTGAEDELLAEAVELERKIRNSRSALWTACLSSTDDYLPDTAREYYDYDGYSNDHASVTARLIREICGRLGGIIPLTIVTKVEDGDVPHILVNQMAPNTNLQLDMSRIRQQTAFNSIVGDVRLFALRMLGRNGDINQETHDLMAEGRVEANVDEWITTGVPYLALDSGLLGDDYQFTEADEDERFDVVRQEDPEASSFVPTILKGLTGLLSQGARVQEIVSRRVPMAQLFVAIGPDRTIVANLTPIVGTTNEERENEKIKIIHKILERCQATAFSILQYGMLDPDGSGVDMQPANRSQLPNGVRVALSLRSNAAERGFITGSYQYTIDTPPGEPVQVKVFAYHEDNPALPTRDGVGKIAELWGSLIGSEAATAAAE